MRLDDFNAHRADVQTRSGLLSYVDIGPADAPAALFVHGVGTNGYLWHNVIDAVRDERRCIALDLPLHGRSPSTDDQDFSLGALADLLEGFRAALGLATVDLVANDTGGAVAQIFAARHPDRLRTFTLTNCDTHGDVPPEAFRPTVELAAAGELAPAGAALLDDPDLARGVGVGVGYEHPERLTEEVLRWYAEPMFGTREAARRFERFLVSITADDLLAAEPALRKVDAPTLIVWGTGDQFFDLRWAYWLRDAIPGASEVVEIPGGKLFFPDERADEFVPHLRRHWN